MFQGHARLRAGHKGLFFERLDAALTSSLDEPPRLTPMARGVSHNRARAYDPATGRFIQRDPNGTAASVLTSVAMHGRASAPDLSPFAMQSMYGDGLNLYQYLGSNPFTRSDPTGLSWDPFSMVDEYLAEDAGNKSAFLSAIGQSAASAAVVAATIATYMPIPILSIAGEIAKGLLNGDDVSDIIAAAALGAVGGPIVAKLGSVAFQVGAQAFKYATKYAARAGGYLADKASGLYARARNFVNRKPPGVRCGCFAVGTLVWTILGPVPIDQIAPGDLVLAIHEHSGEVGFFPVSDLIVTDGAATNAVTLFHDTGDSETLDVTDEHPFWIESRGDARGPAPAGWARADTLAPGDTVRTLAGLARVETVAAEARRQRVHNLSIADARTFLVGDGGAWVHNCHVLQTGGHTIDKRALEELGLTREELRAGIEGVKKSLGIPSNKHSQKIWSNGDVTDSHTGETLGNIFEHIHKKPRRNRR